jgi:mRNA interferase RelE/StbE
MNLRFERSFARDLKTVRDGALLQRVRRIIEQVEASADLHELPQVKPLEGASDTYRIRVGDYRLGLVLEGETVVFVRFLHRKDIYRYFPDFLHAALSAVR